MHYMITATYSGEDVLNLQKYAKGRHLTLPDGVEFIDAWISVNGRRFFQMMKTDNETLLEEWTVQLDDLFEFQVDHVVHVPS